MTTFLIILGFALAIAFAIWARYESSDVHHLKSQLEAVKESRVHGDKYEFYCPYKIGGTIFYIEKSYGIKWHIYSGIVEDIQFTKYRNGESRYALYTTDCKWLRENVDFQKIFKTSQEAETELNKLNND